MKPQPQKNGQNGQHNKHGKHGSNAQHGQNSPHSENNMPKTITGYISTTSKGAGYIDDPDPKKDSIFIESEDVNTALHGDKVEVALLPRNTGKVIRVLERARTQYVGIIKFEAGQPILSADDRKMYTTIRIIEKTGGPAISNTDENSKAIVALNEWTNPKEKPTGTLVRILGKKGDNNVEMESIVLESGFEYHYPAAVEQEAEAIRQKQSTISTEEIAKRRDMRSTLTFTIDPFDAKDFDDAISFKELEPAEIENLAKELGTNLSTPLYEVGVHIADVSHFVQEGSALDKEAIKRGTSVYLVDRTIPMLPEVLSNDLCSLKPHEDKLTFSAVFILDSNARVVNRWFGRTVIHSDHRYTYETAQAAIDNVASNVTKYSSGLQTVESAEAGLKHHKILDTLNNLAKMLMKEKLSHGAIEFEQDEVKFILDEKGKPLGVYRKQRIDTHKLIEEYMLLANREVAKYISDANKQKGGKGGSIYRIHDAPDKDKIKALSFFVKALGYNLVTKDGVVTAHAFNDLLDQIENTPHESLIRTAAIRSMQKAIYSTKNIGHFGLAFKYYTHFTSPIRRYPDVLVHRVLERYLKNLPIASGELAKLQAMAESSSAREIDAAEAERASVKLKQVEYMAGHIGETFQGTVSGVTKWGLYVEEKETRSEGMIHIRNLGEDYYVFDEKSYSIIGEKTKKKFTLGDTLKFKVLGADTEKKTLDYALVK